MKVGVTNFLNKTQGPISDHQWSWGYEGGSWKRPGLSLLVAADISKKG
jgi:hypothetical protein